MSYRPIVANMTKAGSNEKEGIYEFNLYLADGTQCRTFFSSVPDWKMTNISRLQKTPCPVCRKDFICKCMEKFSDELHVQIKEGQWIDKVLAE